jgi:urease accessory protein
MGIQVVGRVVLPPNCLHMVTLTAVLGNASDPEIAHRLRHLEDSGLVEYVVLSQQDILRHRLRAVTDRGNECAIAIPRSTRLSNGAVLLLADDRAIVVRIQEESWLILEPRDAAAALELGYFAGNMHWTVKFAGAVLRIRLEGPDHYYLDRLAFLIADGRVRLTHD